MPSTVSAIEYHERTKHTPEEIRSHPGLDFENKPRPYTIYEDLPSVSLDDERTAPSLPTLEAISSTSTAGDTTDESLDRADLASLCYHAAGITKTIERRGTDHEFRAAACTGALYHIDLYLVCGDVLGLDAGVYHFDPRTDALDRLRDGDHRGSLAAATELDRVAQAPLSVVATSTWWRNAWKYRDRTYRHAFWDSGTVLANLLATATAIDHPATPVLGFADESVATLLGLDPQWTAPIALVAVGTGDTSPDGGAPSSIDPPTVALDSDPVEYPLIYQAWQESTLPDGAAAEAWRTRGERPLGDRGPGDGARVDLDPVGPEIASGRPLHNTIHRRGSCRAYTREPLSFRKVSTVFDRAVSGLPMDVRKTDGPPLQFVDCYWIVNGVEDLPAGAYQYFPGRGDLECLHSGASRAEAQHLALGQELGGDAAICAYFMADLDAVTESLGNRGYRAAQLEAALTAGNLYLATYAHRDLGGTGLTFFDDAVTEFFEPRAGGQTPMFLYTIGRPA